MFDGEIDRELERELSELRPIIRRQEQAEGMPPDPVFVQALRSRLVPAGRLKAQAFPAERPLPAVKRARFLGPTGVVLVAVAAALILLIMNHQTAKGPGAPAVAFRVPLPSSKDLRRGYPWPGGLGAGGQAPKPWVTALVLGDGVPYGARIRLSGSPSGNGPAFVPAFLLFGPSFDSSRVPAIARALGIHTPTRRSRPGDGMWIYATDVSTARGLAGHSVAVSAKTGRLIYQSFSAPAGAPPLRGWNAPHNVVLAQEWLRRLGWPAHMPVRRQAPLLERGLTNSVTLNWPGVGPADAPSAWILYRGEGQVSEATLLPPVKASTRTRLRGQKAAWSDVVSGRVPLAMQDMVGKPPRRGVGVLTRVRIMHVLSRGAFGRQYLVPAYRFEGIATLQGMAGRHEWYAIVSAAK